MAFCGDCGSTLGPSDKFCGECGATVDVVTEPSPAAESATELDPATLPPVPSATPSVTPPPTEVAPTVASTPTEVAPTVSPTPTVAPPASPASPDRRIVLWGAAAAAIAVLIVGLVLFTRDDDTTQDVAATTVPNATVPTVSSEPAVETTVASTIAPPTTVVPTTLAPTTLAPATVPPTTLAPETTAPAGPVVPAGWSPGVFVDQAVVPLFGLNWQGVPSPVITDPSAPLPDGVYSVRYLANDAATITLELHRFEACLLLNDWPCEEGPYTDSDLGVLDVAEGNITLPLDASIGVVIRGQDCSEEIGQGNGADLAAMYAAIAADYDVAFGAGLAAGADPNDLVAALGVNPTTGFRIVDAACADAYGNSVVWKYDGAPTIFVQWPFDYDTGGATDPTVFMTPTAISVSGDNTTLYIYSTFYS